MKRFEAQLTPADEVGELQLASFKRHKRNGTTPGNPKWYRQQVIRPFKPVLTVKLAAIETGQEWHNKHSTSRACPFNAACGHGTTEDYVKAYEVAAGLKPVALVQQQPERRAA